MLFDFKLSRYLWFEFLYIKMYQKNKSFITRFQDIILYEA